MPVVCCQLDRYNDYAKSAVPGMGLLRAARQMSPSESGCQLSAKQEGVFSAQESIIPTGQTPGRDAPAGVRLAWTALPAEATRTFCVSAFV